MIPEGLCQCGCGEKTRIPRTKNTQAGQMPGVPLRFRPGHGGCAHRTNRGERHPRHKGRIKCGRYMAVLVQPDDPFAAMAFASHGSLYVLEHRLEMARCLERCLRPEEVVHHIGDRSDNGIWNLMLFKDNGAHSAHHAELRGGVAIAR